MSAIVCGKRSFFEELPTSTGSVSPPVSKKLRCSSSNSPVRRSPFTNSPTASALIDQLRVVFPNTDKQLLEKALEESGNDLDSAIKSLNELYFGYMDGNSGHMALSNAASSEEYVTVEKSSANGNTPRSGAEWVELFVTEMMNATSENTAVKEQIEVLVRENSILKRAVAIQHERQKAYEESSQEVQQLKQMLSTYQEQLRTLEVNNYVLRMHLRQAQESNNCMPGRFHPDVF
ncbi:UBA-like protein [Cynara cardunculus var. scolymus]|uniref:UBA-like protein n=1 Tax=Cynara cardunculus var. scolymus TaxID=59895 RepID=A0A124SGD5_CYNCS|nr:UBA-like protein [Cynara cardunculus var. scolymus]